MEKLVWLVEQAVMLNHMDVVEVCRFVVDVADQHGYVIDEGLLDSLHNRYSDIDDQDIDAATKKFQQASWRRPAGEGYTCDLNAAGMFTMGEVRGDARYG